MPAWAETEAFNGLDACEEAGVAPEIDTVVDHDGASIPATMVEGLPDLFVGLSEAPWCQITRIKHR